ncbi:P protein-like isoform X2 [Varroa jacobsoni]|uniref:P protein-like isoform X2 n=1 Tax=Varroa jacobsoni TaxID=62625 RepID=UPI000BF649FC|nr:P protein-like isoform X2 [Varroa jacobsoni]
MFFHNNLLKSEVFLDVSQTPTISCDKCRNVIHLAFRIYIGPVYTCVCMFVCYGKLYTTHVTSMGRQSAKICRRQAQVTRELRDTPYLKLSNVDEDGEMSTEPSIDGEEPRGRGRLDRRSRGGNNGNDIEQGCSTRGPNTIQESSLTQSSQLHHSGYDSTDSDPPPPNRDYQGTYSYSSGSRGDDSHIGEGAHLNQATSFSQSNYQGNSYQQSYQASTAPVPTEYLRLPSETTPLLKLKQNRSRTASAASTFLSSQHDDGFYQSGLQSDIGAGGDGKLKHWANILKIVLLTASVVFVVIVMSFVEETKESWLSISLNNEDPFYVSLRHRLSPSYPILRLKAAGPFLPESLANLSSVDTVFALVRKFPDGSHQLVNGHEPLVVPTAPPIVAPHMSPSGVEHMFIFKLTELLDASEEFELLVQARHLQGQVSVSLQMTPFTEFTQIELIMASFVLVGLYVLIIFELCHRTLAAMLGATLAIACLALIGDRPTLEKVVSWLDVETLCLLFGMMVIVAILCETGFFDYTAVLAFRVARGKVWPLITTLCLFTAIISAFLDNVTTILLMTPVTIKLCEVMNLDPKHVLISLVMFSNIGGAGTPVGDPPNVIIISNPKVQASGVTFTNFTMHLLPGVLLAGIGAYVYLRLYYRDDSSLRHQQPQEVVEIQHEIDIWQKACRSLSEYSRDESHVRAILKKKVKNLKNLYRKKLVESSSPSNADFKHNLKQLSDKYKIRNWFLLIKSGVVLSFVITLFFLQSIPELNLSLGWIAILGALALLVLADMEELEGVFGRVEWTTLLFFAALFVVMEALTELKLLQFIGDQTEDWICAVDEEHRLVVGIVIITWVSSLASCFIDNIPFTTVMVKIVAKLGESEALNLPVQPLIYALAFGACLGGNGTLIGASANVVCAGVAEHHGYRFTFIDFFKIGFPVMLVTTSVSTCWLLFIHVGLGWL